MPDFEHAMASRDPSKTTELRGECPKHIVDLLDAVSMSKNETRTALVNRILGDWAAEKMHEHSLVARVVRINPTDSDKAGGAANG